MGGLPALVRPRHPRQQAALGGKPTVAPGDAISSIKPHKSRLRIFPNDASPYRARRTEFLGRDTRADSLGVSIAARGQNAGLTNLTAWQMNPI